MEIHAVLKKFWGYDQFRPLQEDIIRSVLSGKDTLALLPTGGGKSICFQVPVMAQKGIGIVVSPLIALMKDQVENLKKRGINAVSITSGLSKREVDITLDNCVYGDVKFLYLSPERLQSEIVIERIKRMNVSLLAIDEAHCISQWGYDFRPPYLKIAKLREIIPNVPVLALTASATPEVQVDIQNSLNFSEHNIFSKSFERKNIHYLVINEENKEQRLLRVLAKQPGTAIVYVRNRRQTMDVAAFLQRNGIVAAYYHAGDDANSRSDKQQLWIEGKTRVIVATNAFGMGIDKPDVRVVVHLDMPDSPEAYYQEAGRGGRDEQTAYAVLLYSKSDILDLKSKYLENFPDVVFLKEVYKNIAEEYQIALGSKPFGSLDFDLPAFVSKHKYSPMKLINALKLLEKNELLGFSESVFAPSKMMVRASNDALSSFQNSSASWDEFVKVILRSYSGLFNNYVRINERDIARRSSLSEHQVKSNLNYLHELDLINYAPAKDGSQIEFLKERLPNTMLGIDSNFLRQRKKILEEKIDAMIRYVSHDKCRSLQLLNYFGENRVDDCGQCDVCIGKRKSDRNEKARNKLYDFLSKNPSEKLSLPLIFERMTPYSQQTVMESIQFYVEDGLIQFNDKNEVIVKAKPTH